MKLKNIPILLTIIILYCGCTSKEDFYKNMYNSIQKELLLNDINIKVYNSDDTLNKRIKIAEKDKNPLICIIGDKEVQNSSLNIRDKIKKENYQSSLDSFIEYLKNEMNIIV